jgi:hypothetical protein
MLLLIESREISHQTAHSEHLQMLLRQKNTPRQASVVRAFEWAWLVNYCNRSIPCAHAFAQFAPAFGLTRFLHGRNGYKQHAWGADELLPLQQKGSDWFGLGLTIVDAVDSLYLMGMHEQAAEARDWIDSNLDFDKDITVNLFEVSIRLLGGLLGAYTLSGDSMFLEKATDLGERLLPAFASPSGIPYSDVNLKTHKAQNPKWGKHSSLAEVSSVQLEFKYLAHLTGREELRLPAERVMKLISTLPKEDGLAPIWITPETGKFSGSRFTLGARGDSYYEYLLKQWLITGGTEGQYWEEYQRAMRGEWAPCSYFIQLMHSSTSFTCRSSLPRGAKSSNRQVIIIRPLACSLLFLPPPSFYV